MMMSMETGFLTSNSITKSLSRKPTIAKYKLISPNIITCCDGKSSSSLEDNNRPSIHGDWRSFRARLVANEHATTRPKQSLSNQTNPQPINDPHPLVAKAMRTWAHILSKPEQGCLLVATEKLDGVNIFRSTVILVLSMDSTGATGIILNRPSSLKEMGTGVSDVEDILLDRLYFGGPLDEKMVLVSTKRGYGYEEVVKRSGVFEEVMEGLYYGSGEESVGCASEMVKRNEIRVEDVRIFEGNCWWGKAKLREEIEDGYWKMIACSPNIFILN